MMTGLMWSGLPVFAPDFEVVIEGRISHVSHRNLEGLGIKVNSISTS